MCHFASSLGLTAYIITREITAGGVLYLAWLAPEKLASTLHFNEDERRIYLTTTGTPSLSAATLTAERRIPSAAVGSPPEQRRAIAASANVVAVDICLDTAEVTVTVPPATPEQFYYSQTTSGYIAGNDLRLLMGWTGGEIDEAAVYALFQHRAIPSPLSIVKGVKRVPNGHRLQLRPRQAQPSLQTDFQPAVAAQPARAEGAIAAVTETLTGLLMSIPPDSLLYFSGGVDSALLAAQLVACERQDVILVHYSFGPDDRETELARKIAAHLALTYHQVDYRPTDISTMLARMGRDYSFPFGDRSVIPTNLLVHDSLATATSGTTVIDGTGADGAFGAWETRSSLSWLSRPLCRLIDRAYRQGQFWQLTGVMEERFRRARQSLQMTLPHLTVMGASAFDGIFYRVPTPIREEIEAHIKNNIEVMGRGLDVEGRYSLLDLVHVCAGQFAAKTFDPLRCRGMRPFYPFLEPALLHNSLTMPYAAKCPGGEGKALLKKLLARSLPREWVYRPKQGFVPPFLDMLADEQMQEFIGDVVLTGGNPLLDFCEGSTVRKVFAAARNRKALNTAVQGFLWSFIFASGWFQQQKDLQHFAQQYKRE